LKAKKILNAKKITGELRNFALEKLQRNYFLREMLHLTYGAQALDRWCFATEIFLSETHLHQSIDKHQV
jgi:hypothetical protein